MISADAVIAQARQWLGVKFLHQGRTRFGCDCLGFIAGMMAELGSDVLLTRLPRAYGRQPQAQLVDGLPEFTREIPLEPAAMLLIQFPQTPFPSHAVIYTGSSVIHCNQAEGKVVEHIYAPPWTARTRSIWALPLVVYS